MHQFNRIDRSLYSFYLIFFSSRRRHTILVSDWSSDVCSSDLFAAGVDRQAHRFPGFLGISPTTHDRAHLERVVFALTAFSLGEHLLIRIAQRQDPKGEMPRLILTHKVEQFF